MESDKLFDCLTVWLVRLSSFLPAQREGFIRVVSYLFWPWQDGCVWLSCSTKSLVSFSNILAKPERRVQSKNELNHVIAISSKVLLHRRLRTCQAYPTYPLMRTAIKTSKTRWKSVHLKIQAGSEIERLMDRAMNLNEHFQLRPGPGKESKSSIVSVAC